MVTNQMKRMICLLLTTWSVTVFPVEVDAQQVSLKITNPTDLQRKEVIEINLKDVCHHLGIDCNHSFVIKNTLGQEITFQKSHDAKLLIEVSVLPRGEVTYVISKGEPTKFKSYVFGRTYPERLDDLTWENDKSIYRIYGPALQKTGERSFGTDVWVKNTPELLAEKRYRYHMWGWQTGDSLKRAGQSQEAEKIFLNTSFHLDHGNGMDCYSVGASLGCGAPALLIDGQLIFPYCYKMCKILDNGPLRFSTELIYDTTVKGITEHRLITLDKGSHFNSMTVWYDGINNPTSLAVGVVLHSSDQFILDKRHILYADPTDQPNIHQSQIYVGTLFPEGVDETAMIKGEQNHAIGIVHQYKGEPYNYYFGSGWSNYDVQSLTHWQLLADDFLYAQKYKLSVQVMINDNN